mgnify:CR=1 FL=1
MIWTAVSSELKIGLSSRWNGESIYVMEVISYNQLEAKEGFRVQKGMNFGVKGSYSIVLMSTEKNAPYHDQMFENGTIEYEGHNAPKTGGVIPKIVDQPRHTKTGGLTENGKFEQAVFDYKTGRIDPSKIQVYRKIRPSVWVDMGLYDLVECFEKDVQIEVGGTRRVFRFWLKPVLDNNASESEMVDLAHNRMIPGDVQREVYERDGGRCTQCGSTDNLHFDHILPFSKGGSSKTARNIQLLCARHNLSKSDKFV